VRLITRQLWRAFPELDRFTDEQCQRFVNAACAREDLLLRRRALCVAAGGIVLFLPWIAEWFEGVLYWLGAWPEAGFVGPWVSSVWWYKPWWQVTIMLVLLLMLAALAGGLMRDVLLRRRIKAVMISHGSCAACTYFLGGLPVSERMLVTCPECGSRVRVDAALIELAPGGAVFSPTVDNIDKG
jgi:hypothetical protein